MTAPLAQSQLPLRYSYQVCVDSYLVASRVAESPQAALEWAAETCAAGKPGTVWVEIFDSSDTWARWGEPLLEERLLIRHTPRWRGRPRP